MTTVVLINGPINSGKTTLGLALSRCLQDAVFIDGDDHDAPDDAPLATRIEAALRRIEAHIASLSARFLIAAYPLEDADYERLRHACTCHRARFVVVTLAPPLDVALADRGERKLEQAERARIVEMYAEGYDARPFSDLIIDTARLSPDQAADRVVAFLGEIDGGAGDP
ncbi:shikimate kinase [Microvirga puerhi]|uniref:Shikimate kinase n=1 Tax=Microvirga puerhi TaxID=2876078 RepID=A0ABS7VMM1_9HYPH|nr:shikimate kinase [Microvirga puerhi]MBZ6076739.1 shikimate kinase [Microvirga puerhi]